MLWPYSLHGSVDTLDPWLEVTKDSWLLFLEAYGDNIAIAGAAAVALGFAMTWLADAVERIEKREVRHGSR